MDGTSQSLIRSHGKLNPIYPVGVDQSCVPSMETCSRLQHARSPPNTHLLLMSLEASSNSTTAGGQMQVPASTSSPHLPQLPYTHPHKKTHAAGTVHDIKGRAQEKERLSLWLHNIPGLDYVAHFH